MSSVGSSRVDGSNSDLQGTSSRRKNIGKVMGSIRVVVEADICGGSTTYIHTYIHACIHTYIHTYIHMGI